MNIYYFNQIWLKKFLIELITFTMVDNLKVLFHFTQFLGYR